MKIFCDGGSRGNPGPSAAAFVALNDSGEKVYSEARYLGESTNNKAEYTAVLMALEWLSKNFPDTDTLLVLDSELVKKQLSGEYRVKNSELKIFVGKIKNLESSLSSKITYTHTLRENNTDADLLVNMELNRHI